MVVTTLEQRTRPPLRPLPDSALRLVRWPAPTLAAYRALFARVGAPWLWYSRLALDDAALARLLADPRREIYAAVDARGVELGLVELERRNDETLITYFALVPELTGRGIGRWMMAEALARAWAPATRRVWLNTASIDHPRALGFYRAQGFVAVARALESFADPRLAGILPMDAAPHVPIIAP